MANICGFDEIYVWIPRKLIKRCFAQHHFLSDSDCKRLQSKKEDLEKAIMRAQHALSVVDVCLLKRGNK